MTVVKTVEAIQRSVKRHPRWVAYGFGVAIASSILVMTIWPGWKIEIIAAYVSALVLGVGVANYVLTTKSFARIQGQIVGEHHTYTDFFDHILDLRKLVSASQYDHFYLVLSTLAYGIGERANDACAGEFFKVLRLFLKRSKKCLEGRGGKDSRHIILKICIWNADAHRDVFGFDKNDEEKAVEKKIVSDLKKVLSEINDLRHKHPRFSVKIRAVPPLDWRLFLLSGDEAEYGLTALFTTINHFTITHHDWKISAYSSKSKTSFSHFGELVSQVEQNPNGEDVTELVLETPEKFIEQWFYLPSDSASPEKQSSSLANGHESGELASHSV